MKATADISVIIPAYNRAHTLKRTIESALRQTLAPREVIVVDDGSTDGTEAIIESFKHTQVRCLREGINNGAAAARNRGVKEARSQWIAFLDSDDSWMPDKLEKQFAAVTESGDSNGIYFHRVITDDGVAPEPRPLRGPFAGEAIGDYLFRSSGLIQTSSLMGQRELFLKIPFDERLPRHQDWDLCLQLEKAGVAFHFVPEALAVWSCAPAADKVSGKRNATDSIQWMERRRDLLSVKAQKAFLAEVAAPVLYLSGKRFEALRYILSAGFSGSISPKSTFRLLSSLLLPTAGYDLLRKVPFRLRSKKA